MRDQESNPAKTQTSKATHKPASAARRGRRRNPLLLSTSGEPGCGSGSRNATVTLSPVFTGNNFAGGVPGATAAAAVSSHLYLDD